MKRVINGRRYDTDKARLVCEHVSGEPGQTGYSRATLYQKRGGEYFFRHQGPFGVDNIIREPTQQAVRDFVRDNKGEAAYMEEFEAQGLKAINVTIPLDCKRKLDQMANATGSTRGQVIEAAVRSMWDKMESDNMVGGD